MTSDDNSGIIQPGPLEPAGHPVQQPEHQVAQNPPEPAPQPQAAPLGVHETYQEDPSSVEVPWHRDREHDRQVDENKIPRDQTTHEFDQYQPTDDWKPAPLLPKPDPREGIEHRYIRVGNRGNFDSTNVSRQFREGWVACKRDDYPEITVPNDVAANFSDGIEIGGCLLCKMPTERLEKRRQYFERLANTQMRGVDKRMSEQQDRRTNMRILDPSRKTVVGGRNSFD